jgi:hypothetical protein
VAFYADLSPDLLTPVGPLRFVPVEVVALALNPVVLIGLKTVLLVCLGLLVLGVRPFSLVAVPTAVLLLLYDGLMKSFNGDINHAQMAVLYAALVLSVFPSADGLSVFGRPRRSAPDTMYAAPMLVVALLICFAYSFIGTNRLAANTFDIFSGDALVTLLGARSLEYLPTIFGFYDYGLLPLTWPALAPLFKLGYAVTTVLEVLSPLVLFNKWFRRAWLLVIVPFHLTTLLTMNIIFWENILLIAVFLTGLPYLVAWRDREPAAVADTAEPVRRPRVDARSATSLVNDVDGRAST